MSAKEISNTRTRIIEAAITLFNERGSGAVTTNHIAAAAGISPGNLYYHFRNREDIVRAIFEVMETESWVGFAPIVAQAASLGLTVFEQTFSFIQLFNRRFAFFKRELPTLVMRDPDLQQRFLVVHHETLALITQLIDSAMASGILRPLPGRDRRLLAEMTWMLTLFWPNYLTVTGEPDNDAGLARGVAMIRLLIDTLTAGNQRRQAATK